MNWYVIRVVTGKEKQCKEYIEKQIVLDNLDKYVSEIVIPSQKTLQLRKGKKYQVEKNFFPGYIFIECEINGEVISSLRSVKNVIGFLGGKNPDKVKQSEIDRILKRVNQEEPDDIYFVGEIVDIIDGPFSTFSGEITEVDNDKNTIKVDVMIFGRSTPVQLSYGQVKKSE